MIGQENGQAQEQGASIRPTDAVQMGMLDDFNGDITDAKWLKWDYNGKAPAVLALAVELAPDEGDAFVQYYSAGEAALKNFVILTGNTKVRAVRADINGLPKGSNAVKFLSSLVSGGFSLDRMGDDVSVLLGTRAHFLRVANSNKGIVRKEGDKENTILLVEKVLEEGKGAAALSSAKPVAGQPTGATAAKRGRPKATETAAPATNGHTAAPATNGTAIDDKATQLILGILASKGSASKQDLAQAAYQQLGGDPERNAVISRIANDQFLGNGNQPWKYDGATVSF